MGKQLKLQRSNHHIKEEQKSTQQPSKTQDIGGSATICDLHPQ